MTGQAAANGYRIREWAEMISAHKQSGKKVDDWCAEQGISRYMYYYRLRKVRKYAAQDLIPVTGGAMAPVAREAPVFAALPVPRMRGSAATVQIGAYVAEIHNGADAGTVESVLRTLARL